MSCQEQYSTFRGAEKGACGAHSGPTVARGAEVRKGPVGLAPPSPWTAHLHLAADAHALLGQGG